jgi:hypothetical protein
MICCGKHTNYTLVHILHFGLIAHIFPRQFRSLTLKKSNHKRKNLKKKHFC